MLPDPQRGLFQRIPVPLPAFSLSYVRLQRLQAKYRSVDGLRLVNQVPMVSLMETIPKRCLLGIPLQHQLAGLSTCHKLLQMLKISDVKTVCHPKWPNLTQIHCFRVSFGNKCGVKVVSRSKVISISCFTLCEYRVDCSRW
jgi:hypothetical protein